MVKQQIALVNRYRNGTSTPNSKPGAKARRKRREQRLADERYTELQVLLLLDAVNRHRLPER